MILAIDVGSAHTKFGVWSRKKWLVSTRLATADLSYESRLIEIIREFPDSIKLGMVASVKPDAIEILRRSVKVPLVPMVYGPRFGVPIRYLPPESLGADRLANILGALQYEPPVLVVDAGTATTFEAIDGDGAFVGGAIMPGPRAWVESLLMQGRHIYPGWN